MKELVRRSQAVPISLLALVLFVAAGVDAAASALPASAGGAALTEKKRCKLVKKKVRGKTRRVRVCTKVAQAPPRARNVGMTLDSERAAGQEITLGGGTIATSAATGANLALTVPADALLAPTAITITPVRAAALPNGVRLLAAAELGPNGLGLAKPATLAIDLPAGLPARNVHAFGWFGVGENVHRLPVRVSGNRAEISLTHFSGAGIAVGAPGWLPSAVTALTLQYGRSVRPQMRAAETNDELIESAFSNAFGWLRQVELLGLGDRFATWRAEIFASFQKALQNAIDKATERCVQGHDLSQLARLTAIGRQAELMGIKLTGDSPLERVDECARFELDFDSKIASVHDNPQHRYEAHARTTALPIRLKPDLSGFAGEKHPEPVSFTATFDGAGCEWRVDGQEVRLPTMVSSLTLAFDGERGGPVPTEIGMRFFPGQIVYSLVQRCGANDFPPAWHDHWAGPFLMLLHRDEDMAPEPARAFPLIGAWTYVGGEVWARREYHRTKSSSLGTFTEDTTLVLRHTPVR